MLPLSGRWLHLWLSGQTYDVHIYLNCVKRFRWDSMQCARQVEKHLESWQVVTTGKLCYRGAQKGWCEY